MFMFALDELEFASHSRNLLRQPMASGQGSQQEEAAFAAASVVF
jgi:hypothetical protein